MLDRQRRQFQNYLETHLGGMLANDNLPMKERSKIFYNVSVSILRETFKSKLPANLDRELFERIFDLVQRDDDGDAVVPVEFGQDVHDPAGG